MNGDGSDLTGLRKQTLRPVILAVPEMDFPSPKERVKFLSSFARKALALSARKNGVHLEKLEKDHMGAPVPENGVHWSITHTNGYVGGVTGPSPVGIDVEKIKPMEDGMYAMLAKEWEWRLSDEERPFVFFRYWTAKEAVLKAEGTGLSKLAECTIDEVVDENCIMVRYMEKMWRVDQIFLDGHVAAITNNSFSTNWDVQQPD